ncbi:MAG TPA: papain-like cysteine protease family protein [Pyrinomonadaceae bacterium]
MWVNWWSGSEWNWTNQGTPSAISLTDSMGAITVDGERPYVFIKGSDGDLWANWWSGSMWNWADQGTPSSIALTKNLNFNMQAQQQNQWCWSAVGTSTSLFYNSSSIWTQCSLANQQLGQTTCCQNGGSPACNQPWYLDRALQAVGNLDHLVGGTITYPQVQQEINAARPLGSRIGWAGGGGHFVILDGYNTAGAQFLSIRDPWYGSSTYTYTAFSTAYQGNGSWTHSYYTK